MKLLNDAQLGDVLGNFAVMSELVIPSADIEAAIIGTDVGQAECDHTRGVRLKCQAQQVVVQRHSIDEIEPVRSGCQLVVNNRLWLVQDMQFLMCPDAHYEMMIPLCRSR